MHNHHSLTSGAAEWLSRRGSAVPCPPFWWWARSPFPGIFHPQTKTPSVCFAHTSYPERGQGIDRACSRSLEAATWGWGEAVQGAEKPVRPQPLTAGPLPSVRESHVQSLLPRSRPDTAGPADVAPNLVPDTVLVAESTKLLLLCVSVRCAMFPTTLDRGAGHRLSRAPSTCPGQWVRRWHQGPWRPLGRGGWQAAEGFGLGCPAALSCQPTAPPGRPGWAGWPCRAVGLSTALS